LPDFCQFIGTTNAETVPFALQYLLLRITHRTLNMICLAMNEPSVIQSYDAAHDQWLICDWPTEFGTLKLNLMGLRSFQAERLAYATSGKESSEWQKAANWLRNVEADAREAQELATQARDASLRNDHLHAIDLIKQACQIEATWHQTLVWESLFKALQVEMQSTQ